jgi:putative membrane protein
MRLAVAGEKLGHTKSLPQWVRAAWARYTRRRIRGSAVRIAIKVLNNRYSKRFESEARAIAALNHPHICTLYDVGPNYLVIGLVSATLGLVLKIVLLPFIILTLGVVYFLINGLMLKLASEFVPGFRVNGCLPAVLGSILLTIVDYVLNRLAGV